MSMILSALWLASSLAAAGSPPPCLDDAAILGEAKSAFPTRYDKLLSLRQSDPHAFKALVHTTTHTLDDPTMVAALARVDTAKARVDGLAARLAKTPEAQRDALEAELVEAAEALVEARIAVRRVKLERAREELQTLNAEVRTLEAERDAAVDAVLAEAVR